MSVHLKLSDLHANEEAGLVRFGFADAITAQGQLSGDTVEIDLNLYGEVFHEYRPIRGLGDLVAGVAQPIAKAIDSIAGTNLQNCGACKARQAALNEIIPL